MLLERLQTDCKHLLQNVTGGPPASRSTLWKTAKVKHMPEGAYLVLFIHSISSDFLRSSLFPSILTLHILTVNPCT